MPFSYLNNQLTNSEIIVGINEIQGRKEIFQGRKQVNIFEKCLTLQNRDKSLFNSIYWDLHSCQQNNSVYLSFVQDEKFYVLFILIYNFC